MAKRRGGPRPSVKGFRPGKEPAQLKKRRAMAQLGDDATWAQKKAVDAFAGRSPEEVRTMVRRWSTVLLAAAVALALGGLFLYRVALPLGIGVHVLGAVVLFLGIRLRKQGDGLADFTRSL